MARGLFQLCIQKLIIFMKQLLFLDVVHFWLFVQREYHT